MLQMAFSPNWITAGTFVAVLGGIAIWLWVRKRHVRVRLPTVKILSLERQVLPRLRMAPPPWVPFVCFALSALMFLLFALKPVQWIYESQDPKRAKIHILIDDSPSVSASYGDGLATRTAEVFESLQGFGETTFSFATENIIRRPANSESLRSEILSHGERGATRLGLRLSDSVAYVTTEIKDLTRIIIVSDRDQHSWGSLDWQSLANEVQVERVSPGPRGDSANFFFARIDQVDAPEGRSVDFDVEILRTGDGEAVGRVVGSIGGTNLWEGEWRSSPGRPKVSLRLSATRKSIEKILATTPHPLVEWKLQPDKPDVLPIDNLYFSEISFNARKVRVVAASDGERALEDSASQIGVMLSVLGLSWDRIDAISRERTDQGRSLTIVMNPPGDGGEIDSWCPAPPAKHRGTGGTDPKVPGERQSFWLLPRSPSGSFVGICQCLGKLLGDEHSRNYCADMTSRNQWLGLLSSIGGKQVGGGLGKMQEALAYTFEGGRDDMRVWAFTLPLSPDKRFGIGHGNFPVLLRQLLTLAGTLGRSTRDLEQVPRIDNIWDYRRERVDYVAPVQSNVPVSESTLVEMSDLELPPVTADKSSLQEAGPKKEREDARFLILALCAGILVALLIESLWWWYRWYDGRRRQVSRVTAMILFLMVLASLVGTHAQAGVDIVIAGVDSTTMTFATLAKAVTERTSVQVTPAPSLRRVDRSGAGIVDGWLWAQSATAVANGRGKLLGHVETWLRRGGFLVIENATDRSSLENLVSGLFGNSIPTGRGRWEPIPPDHEIMRSFYLLDALPQCGVAENSWYGLNFDGRLAMVAIPYSLLAIVQDQRPTQGPCGTPAWAEKNTRTFVNMLLVSLTMDYKKDQIHLPEILKRLR